MLAGLHNYSAVLLHCRWLAGLPGCTAAWPCCCIVAGLHDYMRLGYIVGSRLRPPAHWIPGRGLRRWDIWPGPWINDSKILELCQLANCDAAAAAPGRRALGCGRRVLGIGPGPWLSDMGGFLNCDPWPEWVSERKRNDWEVAGYRRP